MAEQQDQAGQTARRYDLCVIGAGIAGLNALYVASEYLGRDARVVLIDRRAGPGGMWTGTYDYVRLHQPHGMFTVGDIPWRGGRPPGYLAARDEVRDHLAHCLDLVRPRMQLTELYGHEATDRQEIAGPDGAAARVVCRDPDGAERVIEARRLIDAAGFDVPRLTPLALSSRQVVSVTPETLATADPTAPAYVIGGGKTGMDTVQRLIGLSPRRITVVNGGGTAFLNRNRLFPEGPARWWRGTLQLRALADVAMRFDGGNAEAAFDYFRRVYTVAPGGRADRFMLGILSEEEKVTIDAGVDEFVRDHLKDVADGRDGPELVLRGGARHPVAPGSVFVNCTGHLLRHHRPDVPCLSPGGAILTVSPRAAVHFLSTASAYFLAHLFFLDRLQAARLYELDLDSLSDEGNQLWYLTALAHTFHNTIRLMDVLPFRVLDRCGLDLDRWYPLPRRVAAFANIRLNRRRYLAHSAAALQRVVAATGVRCGVVGE